jgi:hypothetical protein
MKRFYFGFICAVFVAMVFTIVLPPSLVAALPLSLVLAMIVSKLLEGVVWHYYYSKRQAVPDLSNTPVPSPINKEVDAPSRVQAAAPANQAMEPSAPATQLTGKDLGRMFARAPKNKKSTRTAKKR